MVDAEPTEVQNPYPGLRPFRVDERHLFFGREQQVDRMVEKLAARRFLSVVGGSGSGKSSLVNCGLRPALHRGNMTAAGSHWRMAQMRPGSDPIGALALALAEPGVLFDEALSGAVSTEALVEGTLRLGSLGLVDIVEQADLPAGTQLLVVADQFEELFRFRGLVRGAQVEGYGPAEDAVAFVRLLLEAATQSAVPIHVVLTMRSDFLGDCAQFRGLPEAINESQFLVPRLTRSEIRAAITGPPAVRGAKLSSVLVTTLLNDVGDNPDQLSILQHALNRTWYQWEHLDQSQGDLQVAHYNSAGKMSGALDLHADKAFAECHTAEAQRLCAQVFKALTDTGTDARGTRRPTRLETLGQITGASEEALSAVINVFRRPSRSFLMPPVSEALTPQSAIDISHESLMRVWQRLKRWADEEAQSARAYRRLRQAAAEFDKGEAPLWSDPQLRLALEWREKNQPTESWAQLYGGGFASAMAFLDQSCERQRKERQQAEQDARWHSVWSWVPLVITALAFVVLQIWLEPQLVELMKGTRADKGILGPLLSHLLVGMPAAIGYMALAPFVRKNFPSWEARWQTGRSIPGTATPAHAATLKSTELAADVAALGYAVTGRRAVAQVVDWLVCFFVFFVPLSMYYAPPDSPPGEPAAEMSDGDATAVLFLLVLGFGVYHVLMWCSQWRATLGMRLVGIIVTDVAGYRLSPWRATARFFARWLSYYTAGLGFLMALFSQQNKTLHDRMAGTVVLNRRRKP